MRKWIKEGTRGPELENSYNSWQQEGVNLTGVVAVLRGWQRTMLVSGSSSPQLSFKSRGLAMLHHSYGGSLFHLQKHTPGGMSNGWAMIGTGLRWPLWPQARHSPTISRTLHSPGKPSSLCPLKAGLLLWIGLEKVGKKDPDRKPPLGTPAVPGRYSSASTTFSISSLDRNLLEPVISWASLF